MVPHMSLKALYPFVGCVLDGLHFKSPFRLARLSTAA
jgi:hypothetical protein